MKETEEEVKKHRINDSTETNGKSSENSEAEKKPCLMTIYQRVNSHEENEAVSRDPVLDLKIFRQTCEEFAKYVNDIAELKKEKPPGWKEKVMEMKVEAALLTVVMKKMNRIEKLRNKMSRDNVAKVRQDVDVLQLQLQNLLCEIQRLQEEVDKCLYYKSKPLGIDLVPVEEFYKKAPENISRPEITKRDEHQLQLARLEWELSQRKELSVLASQLEEKKTSLSKTIEKKANDLDSLAPLIKDVLNVTKPMQEKLGLVSTNFSIRDELTSSLPRALYFLYIQAKAYSEACDKAISIEIAGSKEKAKQIKDSATVIIESSESESSENEESLKAQKKEKKEKQDAKRKTLLSKHPLSIVLKLNFKDGTSISIEFFYLVNLKIITVLPHVSFASKIKSPTITSLLQNSNILTNLFLGDDGENSPNMANHYQLQEVGLENFDHKKIGTPYLWAQKICGMDFGSGETEPKQNIAKLNIPLIIKEVRRRIKTRIALVKQVIELESGNVIGPSALKSIKLSSFLKSWEIFSWNEYKKIPATSRLKDSKYVSPNDIFFKGTIIRDQAILNAFVSISSNYPVKPPLFVLQLELNNNKFSASNNSDIESIERETNVYWKELVSENWVQSLLSFQIHRVMTCLDIMLESTHPEQFSAEKKTFFHPSRGRNRARPFKYEPIGEGVFLQR